MFKMNFTNLDKELLRAFAVFPKKKFKEVKSVLQKIEIKDSLYTPEEKSFMCVSLFMISEHFNESTEDFEREIAEEAYNLWLKIRRTRERLVKDDKKKIRNDSRYQ